MRVQVGSIVNPREHSTIHSERVQVPDREKLVHLQFRRFAGCPVCNLHLHSIVARHSEIQTASIREVVVFHTGAEELLRHAGEFPFAVIADPEKRLYAEFGVSSGLRALLDSHVWGPILLGVIRSGAGVFQGKAMPPLIPEGGRLGLPADFLIAPDGRVVSCKYGSHAYDQWSVDEILALARSGAATPASRAQIPTATTARAEG